LCLHMPASSVISGSITPSLPSPGGIRRQQRSSRLRCPGHCSPAIRCRSCCCSS
jgi:hypothetical protein